MILKIFLGIGVLLANALMVLGWSQRQNQSQLQQLWQSLSVHPAPTDQNLPLAGECFSQDLVANLPEPVQRYFFHAIAPDTPLARSVHLKMRGDLRLAANQPWQPMQAAEILTAHQGFIWQATVGEGMGQIRGVDYYVSGEGRTRFSLWGLIPLVNAANPDITRSSIGRWIGECVWLPVALLPQRGVNWQVIDHQTLQASLKLVGEPVTLTLGIDADGRLLKMSLLRWGNQTETGQYAYIPFGAEFQQEQSFDGFTIPSQIRAGWRLDSDRPFEFFRATLEQAQFS